MSNFRGRILNAFVVFTSIIFLLLGFLIANLSIGGIERQKVEAYETQLRLVAKSVQDNRDIEEPLEHLAEELDGGLTYYSGDGDVIESTISGRELVDSDRFKKVTNNVQQLKREGYTDFVIALTEGDSLDGFLVLTISDQTFKNDVRKIWFPILFSLFFGYCILIYLTFRLTNKLANPVDDAVRVASELARGNYKARSHEYQLRESGELNHSLNVLARNLEQITRSREAEQERMKTVIENMGSGLLLIDSKGYINLMNRFYKETFLVDGNVLNDKMYHEIMPHEDVVELVKETFLTEKIVRKQVLLSVGITRKHFDVTCVPILGQYENLKGIVLVFHDITELKNLEQVRKDFVANVSHELRTPVTSLKGFAETLLDGAMDNKELRTKFLTIIWKESDRLQRLINDLLDFTKMEQANFQLELQRIDVGLIINDVKNLLETRANEKDIHFVVSTCDDLQIEGDALRIKQILINLVNNAISYTPSGGTVQLIGSEEPGAVNVTVKDTGIGMDDEEIPRIFERFYRIDKARSRNSGGTGLGLAIVKHLVEAHKGSIQVKSANDAGTTFLLSFPKIKK
ncbi:two-component system histidine kinase PnpS [Alkalihalobacillus sp. AL-G]|uniref:two-component system histidine kinase PnpS n=1 Tax=Alkalihalobacillus sp. AL-G TaxID=2926399 RepID=UPI002729EFFA|nr:ATP-binding protein [Alkalihalobacillus sp. AL-G]WLD92341.1 cell wall metabolism sensor histidine kinase WalK [Alkalihalobacillus sp. AL-G]